MKLSDDEAKWAMKVALDQSNADRSYETSLRIATLVPWLNPEV
jgi:hypothetical protein